MSHPDKNVEGLLALFPPPPHHSMGHPAVGEIYGEPIEPPKPWFRRLLNRKEQQCK